MIASNTELLTLVQSLADMVTSMFACLDSWELVHTPSFSIYDVLIGSGFCSVTLSFINRMRSPVSSNHG